MLLSSSTSAPFLNNFFKNAIQNLCRLERHHLGRHRQYHLWKGTRCARAKNHEGELRPDRIDNKKNETLLQLLRCCNAKRLQIVSRSEHFDLLAVGLTERKADPFGHFLGVLVGHFFLACWFVQISPTDRIYRASPGEGLVYFTVEVFLIFIFISKVGIPNIACCGERMTNEKGI